MVRTHIHTHPHVGFHKENNIQCYNNGVFICTYNRSLKTKENIYDYNGVYIIICNICIHTIIIGNTVIASYTSERLLCELQ